jgi:ubiquinone/menaquinone biosynthesis C-methylase UbiE
MKSERKETQKYFDRVPGQWDALYSHENRLKYAINKWLRKGLFRRYKLTFEHCGDLTGARVLDIGCGTGRYSIECAERGAGRVVGIDFAPSMIEYSQTVAEQMEVVEVCEFICGDFLLHQFEESFDVVLALGLFDYIREPELVFKKIASLKPRKFIASFPGYTFFWGIQRKIRDEWIKKCPIYYYTAEQLERLYREAPFSHFEIRRGRRGFFGVAGTV